MKFTEAEISVASRLRDLGIEWLPKPGLYIWDESKQIRPSSPFQSGVYFLLDVDCFIDYFGGVDQLKKAVTWLPTWEQCRSLLDLSQVTGNQVAARVQEEGNLKLLVLYHLLEEQLEKRDQQLPSRNV